MSVAVGSPPSAAEVIAPPNRRVALVLARIEGRRLIQKPFLWFAVAVGAGILLVMTWSKAPVLHRDDTIVALSMLPLAVATYLLSNVAVTRARRNGTEELYNAAPATPVARTTAHLLALAWPFALSIVLTGLAIAYLKASGGVWWPSLQEVATGPMIVLLLGAAGVLVGRIVGSAIAGTVGLIGLATVQLYFMHYSSIYDARPRLRWAAFWLNGDEYIPRELFFRPAGWHLLYLTGIAALFAAAARMRHGVRLFRLVAAGAAIAVLSVGVWGQSRRQGLERTISPEAAARHERLVCQTHDGVRYCTWGAYTPWISEWRGVVSAVFDSVPVPVKPGLTVRQALATPFEDAARRTDGPSDPDVIRTETSWGTRFRAGVAEFALASRAAAWAVGLPVTDEPVVVRWTEESIRAYEAQLGPDSGPYERPAVGSVMYAGPCTPSGQARSIVALWLAARSTPDAANALRAFVREQPYGIRFYEAGGAGYVSDFGSPSMYLPEWPFFVSQHIEWGTAEANYAAQLLDRPAERVDRIIREQWRRLVDPAATTEDAVALFGLSPLPTFDEQLRAAGVDRERFMRNAFPGADPAKVDATIALGRYQKPSGAPCP